MHSTEGGGIMKNNMLSFCGYERKDNSAEVLKIVDGYRLLPLVMLGTFLDYIHGVAGSYYIARHYKNEHTHVDYDYGVIDPVSDSIIKAFLAAMDMQARLAFRCGAPVFSYTERGKSMIFARSGEGYIAVGFLDTENTLQKSHLMSTFAMYGLGLVNKKTDPQLFHNAAEILVFEEGFEAYKKAARRIIGRDVYEKKKELLGKKHG